MKDKQIPPPGGGASIPFVSAALHYVSMTALVYLRCSFGFGFLRPRSVFFAFSWAFTLYVIYAWLEPAVWQERRAAILFGGGALVLYWIHFFTAFYREVSHSGAHEYYSGSSHLARMIQRLKNLPPERDETTILLWGEPTVVLVLSAAIQIIFAEHHLSSWLFWVAIALWAKEALNYWFRIRHVKRQEDMFDDTADTVEPPITSNLSPERPNATRKARVKRIRGSGTPDTPADLETERLFAERLRLLPPYSLEMAEANYRALIKIEHPDANESSQESNVRTAELNDAIEYFRGLWST